MKQLTTFLFSLFLFNQCFSQSVEDFEDESLGGNTFTLSGINFITTGDFLISEFDDFSCDSSSGTNRYIDTGYLDGISSGVFGSISRNDSEVFQVYTNISQCVWPGLNDGEDFTTGNLRITGILEDSSTISEDFQITSTNYTDLVELTFSNSIWGGIDLQRIDFEIINGMDYFALDNFALFLPSLSVNENNIKSTRINPNPADNEIIVTTSDNSRLKYEIYSLTGHLIKKGNTNNRKINIEYLESGLYLLVLDGKQNIKLIKK